MITHHGRLLGIIVAVALAIPTFTFASAANQTFEPAFPIRAAFFYPWFPQAWSQQGMSPYTRYIPALGFYDSSSASVIANQIAAMEYGNVEAGIASWWGQNTPTDKRIPLLLAGAANTTFRWALYYEPEGYGDPSVAQIQGDLGYIDAHYAADPAYLQIGGKPVIFVYAGGSDGCRMATAWAQANASRSFYVVLKVFNGYQGCADQPDNWHQYGPAAARDSQAGHSFTISPGFWKASEATPRLVRNLSSWTQDIADMVASNAPFQLITTFNEWGEGTSVESAAEWQTASGFGAYLDALHDNPGASPTATPTPTPSPSPTPTPTPTPTPPLTIGNGVRLVASATGTIASARSLTLRGRFPVNVGLVAAISLHGGATVSVAKVSDSSGTTWTRGAVSYRIGSYSRVELWYRLRAPAVSSVTVRLSKNSNMAVEVDAFTGLLRLDATARAAASNALTVSGGVLHTHARNDLIFSAISYGTAANALLRSAAGFAASPRSPYGSLKTEQGDAAYRLARRSGTYAAIWQMSKRTNAGGASLAFTTRQTP